MEDAEILVLLKQRRETALDEIIRQYGGMLKNFVSHILPSAQDAEECINDALLDIWNTIPPRHPESVASYAVLLTRRRAIDRIRHMTAQKRGGGAYLMALDELEDCLPADTGPAEDAEALREAINSFLDALPRGDRLLFIGRYFALESISSLAGKNGITKNTVNIRLSRIRRKLKIWLEERNIFI